MSNIQKIETLVVGGGIGGLSCAVALARRGRAVHVIEAAPKFGEIGAGIQLAPNATRALAEIEILDRLAGAAVRPSQLVYMDAHSGEMITAVDCGESLIERYDFPYLVVHRTDLHATLLHAAEESPLISLETGREVTAVREGGAVAVAVCADGSEYEAAALIGADGLRSVVRRLVSDDQPVMSSYVAYRGAIPFSEVSPHARADSMVMWVGTGLHMVQYKLRGGELYNQVGVFRSDRTNEPEWGTPEELDERFSSTFETVQRGAALLDRSAHWKMFDREPIENWSRGRVTLMGDAAHPMLQYIAQGGCQALEDSIALARHLSGDLGVEDAFLAYQRERIPVTAQVQRTARRWGRISHVGRTAARLRNEVLRDRASNDFTALDWLYAGRQVGAAAPAGRDR